MSTSGDQSTLDVRVPTGAVTDKEEGVDTVSPLPLVKTSGNTALPHAKVTRSKSVPVTSTPYRISRKTFHSASDAQGHGPPSPPNTIMETGGFPSDQAWIRDRDVFVPFETAHIRLKPDVRPASIAECDPVTLTAARCLNERLDKYMVIRQRSFHGLMRSKQELRTLPLTDPRDPQKSEATPSWLHRSKTDLYIEKRRAKIKSQRSTRDKALNLNGMTFGNLVDNLPSPVTEHPRNSFRKISRGLSSSLPNMNMVTNDTPEESRLPPLSLNKMKQMIRSDMETFSGPDTQKSSIKVQDIQSVNVSNTDANRTSPLKNPTVNTRGRGKLRKQPLTAIPLGIWEPSFDYVVVSNPKMLSPTIDNART